jgi:hypothetical protein
VAVSHREPSEARQEQGEFIIYKPFFFFLFFNWKESGGQNSTLEVAVVFKVSSNLKVYVSNNNNVLTKKPLLVS